MSLTELYGPYELNRYDAEQYEVERDRVLALQALLMTELRPVARTHRDKVVRSRPPKITGFVFLLEDNHVDIDPIDIDPLYITDGVPEELVAEKIESIKEEVRKGGSDRYFGVMARQLSPRERRLSISVLNYTVGQQKSGSTRDIHQFYWRSDSDVALGSKRTVFTGSDAKLKQARVTSDGNLEVATSGESRRSVFTEIPTGYDFDDLEQQVQQTIDRLKAA